MPSSTEKLLSWTAKYEGGTFEEISGLKWKREDESTLERLGKKQELKRRFSFLSIFGFSCTVMATWEASLMFFQPAFNNGGPAGLAWGYPIVWLCSTSVYLCLAEMASIAPIAGGQYFWVSILAPPHYKKFLSYLTGWLTTFAWMATLANNSVMIGMSLQGVVKLNNPGYEQKSWQGAFFAWCIILVAVVINTVVIGLLPFLEGFICILHILGFSSVMIILLYLSPHVSASDVFLRSLNEGMWPTQGLSFLVGFVGNINSFIGVGATVHMAEEIENAALNVPRAMFYSLCLNGGLGYAMILALLFCTTDIQKAVTTDNGSAYIQIFADGAGKAGATVMIAVTIFLAWFAAVGYLAAASRMLWAFSRDQGVPFHRLLRKVNRKSSIPILAIAVATMFPMVLDLILIGSEFVYTNIISVAVSGMYLSYLLPCGLLLWRRTSGKIKPYNPEMLEMMGTTSDSSTCSLTNVQAAVMNKSVELPLMWGPWRLPSVLGTLNNTFACTYCVFVLFWIFWPTKYPATSSTMNYGIAVIGCVFVFSIAYYKFHGRRNYRGPLVELGKART